MEKESAPFYECHVNTNEGTDTFVGIRSDGGQIKVCFPVGYNLGKTEAEQKKDIQVELDRVIQELKRKDTDTYRDSHAYRRQYTLD